MYKLLAAIIILFLSTSLFAQNSKDPEDVNKQAIRAYEKGEYSAAISGFTKVIELTSTFHPKGRIAGSDFANQIVSEDSASSDSVTVVDPREAFAEPVVRGLHEHLPAGGQLLEVVLQFVFAVAATRSLTLLSYGIFAVAVLINGPVSLLWMYLPRMYPTHLRGTGEGFAHNVGSRMLGTFAAVITTQLSNVMPGASAPASLAYSAAVVAAFLVGVALLAVTSLCEPASDQLPTWTPEHA